VVDKTKLQHKIFKKTLAEEEKLLMQGSSNVENKDDFWISLSIDL
jgi:hypothetical protein